MTFLDKKPFIFLWRPIYRHILERLKDSFLAEPLIRMDHMSSQIEDVRAGLSGRADLASRIALVERQNEAARSDLAHRMESLQQQTRELIGRFSSVEQHHRSILDRVSAMEQENRRQWEVLEQLLLAFLSDRRRGHLEESGPHRLPEPFTPLTPTHR
jgi:hypothetical protein